MPNSVKFMAWILICDISIHHNILCLPRKLCVNSILQDMNKSRIFPSDIRQSMRITKRFVYLLNAFALKNHKTYEFLFTIRIDRNQTDRSVAIFLPIINTLIIQSHHSMPLIAACVCFSFSSSAQTLKNSELTDKRGHNCSELLWIDWIDLNYRINFFLFGL